MHRQPLLSLLERYARLHPDEGAAVERIRALVREHADCFERSCLPGHITASAWILSHEHDRYLLTHHRKLDKWLQLGGHADGDGDVLAVALREAREESGMAAFRVLTHPAERGRAAATPMPLDVDVHAIPARGREPAHEHHDIRFLLVAGAGQPLVVSDESNELGWFAVDDTTVLEGRESVGRLWRKALAWVDV